MKTLVFFGSARKNGHTRELLDLFLANLEGEYELLDAYRLNINPCLDCRNCWKEKACPIDDDMQAIYRKIDQADNILVASPIYFYTVTGPLKTLIDRCQVYWAGRIRQDRPEKNIKKAGGIFVGGAPEFENQFLGGEIVLDGLFKDLSADKLGLVKMSNSDRTSLEDRPDLKLQLKELAEKFNENKKRP